MPDASIHIDAREIRATTEGIYTEIKTDVEPRLLAALAKIQGPEESGLEVNGPPIGRAGADYAGTVMGQKLAMNAADPKDWINNYMKSIEDYATDLAVVAESMVEADKAAAYKTTTFNGPADWDRHGNTSSRGMTPIVKRNGNTLTDGIRSMIDNADIHARIIERDIARLTGAAILTPRAIAEAAARHAAAPTKATGRIIRDRATLSLKAHRTTRTGALTSTGIITGATQPDRTWTNTKPTPKITARTGIIGTRRPATDQNTNKPARRPATPERTSSKASHPERQPHQPPVRRHPKAHHEPRYSSDVDLS